MYKWLAAFLSALNGFQDMLPHTLKSYLDLLQL